MMRKLNTIGMGFSPSIYERRERNEPVETGITREG